MNLEGVIAHVCANLKVSLQESHGTVRYRSLPALYADESLMIQLFQNLIGNSLKFRGARAPIISIKAVQPPNGRTVGSSGSSSLMASASVFGSSYQIASSAASAEV